MRIAIDLDNTVFDTAAKYRAVVEAHDGKYTPPVSYDVYKNGYSVAAAAALHDLLHSDELYKATVFDQNVPDLLNNLYNGTQHDLFYITERLLNQHTPTLLQMRRAGIICDDTKLVHRMPKIDALKEYKIDLCFDDAPHVVSDCITNNIDVVMISNYDTAYNHYLRESVEYYADLATALKKRGIIE